MVFEAFLEQQSTPRRRGQRLLALIVSVLGHSAAVLGIAALIVQPREPAFPSTRIALSLRIPPPGRSLPAAPPAEAKPVEAASSVAAIARPLARAAKRRSRPTRSQVAPTAAPPSTAPAGDTTGDGEPSRPSPIAAATAQPSPASAPGSPAGASVAPAPSPASAPPRPRFVPEALGASQKLAGDLPRLPAALARPGASYSVMTRICVSEAGEVSSVSIERSAHPTLDRHVADTLSSWRYRPLLAGNTPIPFCTFARFEFRSL